MELLQEVFTSNNINYLLRGLRLTLTISVSVVALSILFGSVLGLLRNYGPKVLRSISGIYIEIFRNTPLLLWMLACSFLIPVSTMTVRGGFALMLYTSSVVAEIVRGGLNSIPKGQFEAASSQGFTFLQTLRFVILPQCFRRIIPSLLSQVITTIKDTAFLAGLGIAELMRSGQVVLSRYTDSAAIFIIYATIAATYFVICFSLSCVVRNWQHRNNAVTVK